MLIRLQLHLETIQLRWQALSKTYLRAPGLFSGQGMRLLGEMVPWSIHFDASK
jgi:hypothetical protein